MDKKREQNYGAYGYEQNDVPYTTVWVRNNPAIDAHLAARRAARQQFDGGYAVAPRQQYAPQAQRSPYAGVEPINRNRQPVAQQEYGNAKVKKAKKSKKVYNYRARKPILAILTLFMLIILAVNILPVLGVLPEYTAPIIRMKTVDGEPTYQYTSLADPIMSFVTFLTAEAPEDAEAEIVEDDTAMISERFYYDCLSKMDKFKPDEANGVEGDMAKVIAYYALPIVVALFAILTIYLFIKFLVATVTGKNYKFAYSLLVGVLYIVAMAFLLVIWNNLGMSELSKVFLTPITLLTAEEGASLSGKIASIASVGLGFYITAVLYVLGLILNIFSYKKTEVRQGYGY